MQLTGGSPRTARGAAAALTGAAAAAACALCSGGAGLWTRTSSFLSLAAGNNRTDGGTVDGRDDGAGVISSGGCNSPTPIPGTLACRTSRSNATLSSLSVTSEFPSAPFHNDLTAVMTPKRHSQLLLKTRIPAAAAVGVKRAAGQKAGGGDGDGGGGGGRSSGGGARSGLSTPSSHYTASQPGADAGARFLSSLRSSLLVVAGPGPEPARQAVQLHADELLLAGANAAADILRAAPEAPAARGAEAYGAVVALARAASAPCQDPRCARAGPGAHAAGPPLCPGAPLWQTLRLALAAADELAAVWAALALQSLELQRAQQQQAAKLDASTTRPLSPVAPLEKRRRRALTPAERAMWHRTGPKKRLARAAPTVESLREAARSLAVTSDTKGHEDAAAGAAAAAAAAVAAAAAAATLEASVLRASLAQALFERSTTLLVLTGAPGETAAVADFHRAVGSSLRDASLRAAELARAVCTRLERRPQQLRPPASDAYLLAQAELPTVSTLLRTFAQTKWVAPEPPLGGAASAWTRRSA